MFTLDTSIMEIMIRALSIYCCLFFLFRLAGKKQLGKMSAFDLVLVLIISESVSNALGAQEHSILGGLLSAATLIGLSRLMDYFSFKSKKFEKWAEGQSKILILDGVLDEGICRSERITVDEVRESLRELGIEAIQDVRIGFLETNGRITAFKKIN